MRDDRGDFALIAPVLLAKVSEKQVLLLPDAGEKTNNEQSEANEGADRAADDRRANQREEQTRVDRMSSRLVRARSDDFVIGFECDAPAPQLAEVRARPDRQAEPERGENRAEPS